MSFDLAVSQLIVAADTRNKRVKYCTRCKCKKSISEFTDPKGLTCCDSCFWELEFEKLNMEEYKHG